jgi:alcohol dehydrogenase class IV
VTSHRADVLVGLGGGSPIDTAKALAVLAVRGGPLRDLKAPFSYDGPALPVAAIPTTAGTGSEATRFTVITDSDTGEKMLCAGSSYLPVAGIVDYELTMSMPPRLTADTGIDALTHAVEAYVSSRHNAFSDAVALRAITIIGRSLRTAHRDGADHRARAEMMEAATLAGIAFSNSSVALVHGMSRPLGAHFHISHGMSNAMLFAAVTEFSLSAADDRYADCARALGVADDSVSDADAAATRAEGSAARRRGHTGSVARTRPHSTHDHTTRNRSSSRISNVRASPQVGQTRGSTARALIHPPYGRCSAQGR